MGGALKVKQFIAGSCYSYILSARKEVLIIDPHISLKDAYIDYLNKEALHLKFIVDTHTHADHFSSAAVLKNEFNVPVIMHEKAVSSVVDRSVKNNDDITLGNETLKVIYTPGHTDDSITVHAGGMLFTGDVLLIGSVGRTDFQNGSPESMFDTLQRLKIFPDDTIVYPGHDYHEKRASTIAGEKADNPFLKISNKSDFVNEMRTKTIPKPFNIDNIVRVNQKGEAASIRMMAPGDAYALASRDQNVRYLDVRSIMEFHEVHIKDAINIPIDALAGKMEELSRMGKAYIVLCRTGNRSPMAADMLMHAGINSVNVLDGGMIRWQRQKLPVVKGLGGVSLERQVRVIAGSLILLGIILGKIVSPWLLGISIFVSCGLIFAGLTDSCLMGILLMKLPYNKNLYKAKSGGGTCSVSE